MTHLGLFLLNQAGLRCVCNAATVHYCNQTRPSFLLLTASPTPTFNKPAATDSKVFCHPTQSCIGPLSGPNAFFPENRRQSGGFAGIRTTVRSAFGYHDRLTHPKTHPPLVCFSSNVRVACRAAFMLAQSMQWPTLMSRDVTGRDGGADGRDLSGVATSMRTPRLKKPTPAVAPH
jgi:hypothetical protein